MNKKFAFILIILITSLLSLKAAEALSVSNPQLNKKQVQTLSSDEVTTLGSAKPTLKKTAYEESVPQVKAANGKVYTYTKKLAVKATAYTASAAENGGWGAVDYFGNKLKVGTVAVDPKVIPLGTKLYITGYDYAGLPEGGMLAVASDIGGAVKGNKIDIFVPDSRSQAMKFGIQKLKVFVIE
ncbi:3D domain-containing protein [Paenibacillus yanchengensis]|uniref:3D domain-containing protein n=1 Tax=Paenibacillus yanchengensis TaxID=2035833 RepID=A0ABW4YPW2_9BACL